jgi:hypothetical protein
MKKMKMPPAAGGLSPRTPCKGLWGKGRKFDDWREWEKKIILGGKAAQGSLTGTTVAPAAGG